VNEVPPDPGRDDEVDDLYRRASALDSSRPSESVRRAVLDHAAQLAAQRLPETGPVKIDFTRPAANHPWRRPAIFGTLAAAALAGLIVAPQFLTPRAPITPVSAPTLAQNEGQSQDRMFKRESAPPSAEAKNNLEPRAGDQTGASSAKPAAEMAANDVPARKTRSSADAPSMAKTQSLAATQSAAGARSSATAQSADKAQSTDNVQSAPSPQDAATAQNSPTASGGLKTDARRMEGVTAGMSALSAPPHAAAPMAGAGRLADPAAELRRAAEIGDLNSLQLLVDKHPEIDARDPSGRTALMMATLHGQAQAVEVLLAHGADPNAADARGTTPLQAAIAGAQPVIAAALRRAGAQ
jgi:Ankyrin repeats (3 copies)